MNRLTIIAIIASVFTVVAGIYHLKMVPSNNVNATILFLVGGLAQLFWVIPTIRNWGRIWDYIGIAGTIAFISIWAITRIPSNPITGRGGLINQTAIIVEVSQIIFVILLAILAYKRRSPHLKRTIENEK
jgi:hypothetical protein